MSAPAASASCATDIDGTGRRKCGYSTDSIASVICGNSSSSFLWMRAVRNENDSIIRSTWGSSQASPSICSREAILG